MKTDPAFVVAAVMGFFVLYVVCRIFIKPIKWIFKLLLSCLVGGIAMLLLNRLGGQLGIDYALNPLTVLIGGVLGAPGLIMTFVLQNLL